MSHEKTVDAEWGTVDSGLEGSGTDPWTEMTDREVAEEVERIRENTPEKDLRVKALEDRNMIEFSDISEKELNPESYSDQKEYALGLLEDDLRGASEKYLDEREEIRELKNHHERRADIYGKAKSITRKSRMPSALTSFISTPASAGFFSTGDPVLGSLAAVPPATFFASMPAEALFDRFEKKHRHHGNYVRTSKFGDEAYPLFDAADFTVASRDGDRNLFQKEALKSYEILEDGAELVHAAEIEDYNPAENPYAVDLRVDVHPRTGEGFTDESAEEIQYVLVGGEELKEAYKDLAWD